MKTLQIEGSAAELRRALSCEGMPPLPVVKRQVLDYQLMALYHLARQYNVAGAEILEIGTGHGGSGYMLAHAAPLARVKSITTEPREAVVAEAFWHSQGLRNVWAEVVCSWDLLRMSSSEGWSLVFVDGDHNRIARDLPWFNRLRVDGLLVCHDYSPAGSRSPSPVVHQELDHAAERLGRPFDVRVVDDGLVGMAGFYRRAGEVLA